MRASQRLHLLAGLQVFQANGTRVRILLFVFALRCDVSALPVAARLLLFFVFERRDGVDDVFDLFWGQSGLTVLV